MKILLAQTLKPAWETRLAEKILPGFDPMANKEIVVLGASSFPLIVPAGFESTHFKPFFKKGPGWVGRLWFQSQFFSYLILHIPDVILLASPELLPVSFLFRLFYGVKIIWDVQENFALNWSAQSHRSDFSKSIFPPIASQFLSWAAKSCDGVIFAEGIYQKDVKKLKGNYVVLQNKVPNRWLSVSPKGEVVPEPYFLFSGVLTRESGVITALNFMKKWTSFFPEWKLLIAGYCPDSALRRELSDWVRNYGWVKWVGDGFWLDSLEIKYLVAESRGILMPYRESKANFGKRPTKWFESRFVGKPALVHSGGHFAALEGVIQVNFAELNFEIAQSIFTTLDNWNEVQNFEYLFEYQNLTTFLKAIIDPDCG